MRSAVASFLVFLGSSLSFGQSLSCVATAENVVVRAEGHAERTGDIDIRCSGGQPGQPLTGNLTLFLSVNLTNRLAGNLMPSLLLLADSGAGYQPVSALARRQSVNSAVWDNVQTTLSPEGKLNLKIRNIRAAASQAALQQQIVANLAFNAGSLVSFFSPTFSVAVPLESVLGNASGRLICAQSGSPVPEEFTFAAFHARSAFATQRVTEGFADAFARQTAYASLLADSGTRIIVRYRGFPERARVFVPDVIAGADAVEPTSTGELGFPASGGLYLGGQRSLLLARVAGADSTGAGGNPIINAPPASAGIVSFQSVSEVPLSGGEGYAVYEVIDEDPNERQTAQIPSFLGLPANAVPTSVETEQIVTLAPASTVNQAATTAPIPRFNPLALKNDCAALGDCNAPYLPRLNVAAASLEYLGRSNEGWQVKYVNVTNAGGGVLRWSAAVHYMDGVGWLRLSNESGVNNGTLRLDANPAGLAPGVYRATLTVTAGPYQGSRSIPVTLTVLAPDARPAVRRVSNGASPDAPAEVVPGSLAFLSGFGLSGSAVRVTVDGVEAVVASALGSELIIVTPPSLVPKASAPIVVTVDGRASEPLLVRVSAAAPAIFPGAIFNEDSQANGAERPAKTGTVLQIFATGLPVDGELSGRVHDLDVTPEYAGPVPGTSGVYQFNLRVDPLFPTMQTFVYVCGTPKGASGRICSAAAPIWIERR
jgi:uncharacterized protein (TIGR03437 family)